MTPLKALQTHLKDQSIDLAIISSPETIAYLTRFLADPHERICLLFVTAHTAYLFVPHLDKSSASQITDLLVYSYLDSEDPWNIIHQSILSQISELNSIGIQEASLTVSMFNHLSAYISSTNFVNIDGILNTLKMTKIAAEITKLQTAGKLADIAIETGISALRVGISEQEVAAIIEFEMKQHGVQQMSFSTMVLFGDHASNPHGVPGKRQLCSNELVLFDLGVIYEGYASDISRTVSFGTVSTAYQHIYQTVLEAQITAQKTAQIGITAHELDQVARKVIENAGYGEYFIHRLGHGIGQSVHEYPSIQQDNSLILTDHMCFSIEPGIYIPGQIGIRIEDCVYLDQNGAHPFTQHPKSLQTIPIKH